MAPPCLYSQALPSAFLPNQTSSAPASSLLPKPRTLHELLFPLSLGSITWSRSYTLLDPQSIKREGSEKVSKLFVATQQDVHQTV